MTKNITFSLPAEALDGASEAFLLGDFNNWNPENAPKLEKQKDGSFKTSTKLEEGKTYQYRFLLNDGRWVNDYNAQSYTAVAGLHVDNCVITVPVSKTEETKKAQSLKRATAIEEKENFEGKTSKTANSEKANVKTAKKSAPAKSATAKTSKSKSVQSAAKKVSSSTTEKPIKATKKSAPKTIK